MTKKEKRPRSVGALTEAKQQYAQDDYTPEFTEKQAEIIFKRDTRLLYIGAGVVAFVLMVMEVLAC